MGQSVTVANASGEKVYVKVQSSVNMPLKFRVGAGGAAASSSECDLSAAVPGKMDVEVS